MNQSWTTRYWLKTWKFWAELFCGRSLRNETWSKERNLVWTKPISNKITTNNKIATRSTPSPKNDLEGGQKSPSILATPTHYGLHYKSSTDTNDHFPDTDSWVLNCLLGTTISTTHQLIMLQSIMILAHLGERLVVPCWAKKKILQHIGFVPTITCISMWIWWAT